MANDEARPAHWNEVWSTKSPETVSWFRRDQSRSIALVERYTSPSSAIIDVGGGATTIATGLLERGYRDVTVLDISQAALDEVARQHAAHAQYLHLVCADASTWVPPSARFDLWHDRATLHFLTEASQRRAYADAAKAGIRPGGHLVVASFAPDGPTKCSGLEVHRYSATALAELFDDGFRRIEHETETHITPNGGEQAFVWAVFERHSPTDG